MLSANAWHITDIQCIRWLHKVYITVMCCLMTFWSLPDCIYENGPKKL